MTNKKFTDDEIIKALECCIKMGDCLKSKCPFSKEWGLCLGNEPQKLYLDLINRQKSEIDRLKSELSNTRRKALLEAASKFAGHSNYHGDTILCKLICMAEGKEVGIARPLDMSEIKVEAYKEFAERLKKKSFKTIRNYGLTKDVVEVCDIDNLAKEMVGEEE